MAVPPGHRSRTSASFRQATPEPARVWLSSPDVAFQPHALTPVPDGPGEIDYRLARRRVLTAYRNGEVDRTDICDAHPELRRAGAEVGTPTRRRCPVCEERAVVDVTYVFGPRLPAFGRCITSSRELARLRQRKGAHTAYVVEVCPGCAWNHLVRAYLLRPADS